MDPNIILVVADCLRRDRLGCYGHDQSVTPAIDDLANRGRKFETAYSTGSWTVPAHGSLFTGTYPTEHGAHADNKHLSVTADETLAGQLSSEGYDTVGFSTNPWLSDKFGFACGFNEFYEVKPPIPFEDAGNSAGQFKQFNSEGVVNKWGRIFKWILSGNPLKRGVNGLYQKLFNEYPIATAKRTRNHITEWLTGRDTDTPFFLFVNFMDVHEPYRIRPEYLDTVEQDGDSFSNIEWNLASLGQSEISSEARDRGNAVYDSSIRYLDDQIGELLSWLDARGEMDETMIIVTSDHGQCLGEHGYWGHGTFLFHELVDIPLILFGPDNLQSRWPDPSMTISFGELPHYILHSIGRSFKTSSSSLQRSAEAKLNDNDEPVLAESLGPHEEGKDSFEGMSDAGYRSVYFGEWRLLREMATDSVVVDSKSSEDESEAAMMQEQLIELESDVVSRLHTATESDNETGIDQATKQRLAELGYIDEKE